MLQDSSFIFSFAPLGPKSSSEFLLKSLSSPWDAVGTSPAQKLTGRLLRAEVGLTARGLLEGNSGTSSHPGSPKFHFHSLSLLIGFLDGVLCKKSEILCTKKSRSFRLAKKKVILLLVLMDRGLGKTLELSAFSTIVTRNVHLVEWCPQRAVCVSIQALILGQPESGTVAFIFGSSIKVSFQCRDVLQRLPGLWEGLVL